MKLVGDCLCNAVAMCFGSESQIMITSQRLSARADVLTLTLSRVGLGVLWKVLIASYEGAGFSSVNFNVRYFSRGCEDKISLLPE